MSERGPEVWDIPDRTDAGNYELTPEGTSSADADDVPSDQPVPTEETTTDE